MFKKLGVLVFLSVTAIGCGGGSSSTSPTAAQGSFDDGTLQGWIATGLWHLTSNRASNGANSVWYANPATGTFETDDGATPTPNPTANAGTLTSPPTALGANPTLDFDFFLANECQEAAANYICSYDALSVEISNDNGTSFNRVAVLPESRAGFTAFKVDLYQYANQTVLVRFGFDTFDEINNDEEGAYIDNVVFTNNASLATGPFPLTMSGNVYQFDLLAVPLHFSFPFQGSNYTSTSITINGILDFATANPDNTQTVAEFLAGNPRIAMLWNDLDPDQGGSISYQRTATSIIFTFAGVQDGNSGNYNDFTATLNDDGSIVIAYGTLNATNALVGVTPGGGAVDPGEADLSLVPNQSATGVTYENFTGGGTDDVDLSGTTVTFN